MSTETTTTRNASPDAPNSLGGLVKTMFTRGSPLILMGVLSTCLGLRVAQGGWHWTADLLAIVGVVAWWPFQEWLIHTYLLHWKPRRLGPITIDFAQSRKHRRHHQEPWKFEEISIPLHTYTYAVPILFGLAWLGWETPGILTGLTAYVALGLHYEWCHFMAHSNYVPRTWAYKAVWRNHRLHHFKNETLWMGVSTRVGDLVLGTCPDQKTVERSPNCRTLGVN